MLRMGNDMFGNQYLIFSGYHYFPGAEWFHKLWYKNLFRSAKPDKVVTIGPQFSPGGAEFKTEGTWIEPTGDLGSCGQLLRREKQNSLTAVSATWMLGLWYAYMCERDAIYVEQDVLVFGHWIERMYGELDKKAAIFGTAKTHGIATSLFLIRHAFIPAFVMHYLQEGPEDHANRIPELKVARIEQRWPDCFARYSFPYDTDRPIDPKMQVWFAQKFTRQELLDLEVAGLIDCKDMPEGVELFSNRGPVDP
jgi:hypothetical protein